MVPVLQGCLCAAVRWRSDFVAAKEQRLGVIPLMQVEQSGCLTHSRAT